MIGLNHTHCPEARSWVEGASDHPEFPVQNLPLGIFTPKGSDRKRGGVAIGDRVIDIGLLANVLENGAATAARLANGPSLNALFAGGNDAARDLRLGLFDLLTDERHAEAVEPALHDAQECTLHLPFQIGDYTDFYAGIHHAENVGRLFRPDNPLLPNYKYVPIGYHGRASSILPSGIDVIRPHGQTRAPGMDEPRFEATGRLDYELEMAVWVSGANRLGRPIPIDKAKDHFAGLSLLNDWSARDIQAWEYQPLGPFLAKNFHSTVSPWVVTSAALAPFRIAQPARSEGDPAPLDYLLYPCDQSYGAFAIEMEVHILTETMRAAGVAPERLSHGPMSSMYWTVAQLLTHHAVNGCNLRAGDLLGTGTLSGAEPGSQGSLLELSEGGKEPVHLANGETRRFLENGDEIIMTAHARQPGCVPIGFGECRARVVAG